jgi:ATP-dependent helicase HrpB
MELVSRFPALPIDAVLPEILASLERHRNLVIEAAPGAGKTTRVPPALLSVVSGQVVVLEPRRIAARMAARRVAAELGEPLGGVIGYQVRFEEVAGPRTRLRFVTEGVLTRRLISDPDLRGVSAVILDEFHERHLDGDLALALLKRAQKKRPELRIIVMSATLDAAPVAHYLGDCPVIRSEGRRFPLSIAHLPYSPAPLEAQIRGAFEALLREGLTGDILAFLPGAAEIRRAARECEDVARRAGVLILPLHGSLSPEEQDRAVAPAAQPKLILATNVAESSITIDGVTAVIDSGLARQASWSPWTGLQMLQVGRVSKASATQRAGRAARTAPGRVLRTYTAEDYQRRPDHDVPEILRSDLSQLCLTLRAMRINPLADIAWLNALPEPALASAESLLDRLGATDESARRLARFPLPPRLSRLLLCAEEKQVAEAGCRAAAILSAGLDSGSSDLLAAMDRPSDPRLRDHIAQLRKLVRTSQPPRHDDDALLQSVLAAFPDRVARLRAGSQVLLSSGGSAEIIGTQHNYEYMVALDAENRSDKPLPIIRMTARVEPEWLIDLFPDRVREEFRLVWNRATERIEASSVLLYDELVIQ